MISKYETHSHISGPGAERLIEAYRGLLPDERRILQVISVICQPATQTQVQKVLRHLGWKDPDGRPLSELMALPLREHLLGEGLIFREQALIRCHPDLLEVPAREAAGEGSFGGIARAADRAIPLPERGHWVQDPYVDLRRLRLALYQGRHREVLRQLGRDREPYEPADYSQNSLLIRACVRPLDTAFFDCLHEMIRFQVLASLLPWAARYLQEETAAYELMERHFPALIEEHRAAAHALAEQHLWRGHLAGVEELLTRDDSDRALVLLGWLRFLQGEYETAIGCFEAAIRETRRKTRKRNLYIPGLPGVFHVLALMRRGERVDLERARDLVRICTKASRTDFFEAPFRILEDGAAVLLGLQRADQSVWLQRWAMATDPYLVLFRCLTLRWLGAGPRAKDAAKLPGLCQVAGKGGYLWYARESAALLESLGKGGDCKEIAGEVAETTEYPTLLDLIKPRAAWELALDALRQLPGKAGGQDAGAGGTDRRLAWQLSCHGGFCTLEPREQKRNKRGGWSRGRPVALQRLHDAGQDLDYLTPQDRQICAHIVAETEYGYYGHYPKTLYRLDQDKALLAAVGHPLVIRQESPDARVDLVRAAPMLQVAQEKGRLRLRVEPPPPEPGTLVSQPEGTGRLRLIAFDPEHLRIAEILGPQGLSVPLSAKTQVLDSISAIAPLLTVHSDVGGDAGGEPVEADPRPHLHLEPAGDGLHLGLYVQPFPGGGPLFRPGQGSETLFAEVEGKPLQTTRDPNAERRAAEQVLEQCPSLDPSGDWDWVLDDAQSALEALAELQDLGEDTVLEWPQGRKIRLAAESDLGQMQIGVRKERDWLALDGKLKLDDGRVLSMMQLLQLVGQSPGRFVRLGEDEFLRLSRELRTRLDAIRGFTDKGRFHPLAAPAIDEAIAGMQAKGDKPWKDQLARLAQAQALQPQIPSTLQAELRDYQAEGFRWLVRLAHWGAGACLADDMGLGKTIQALALILERAPQGPALVLAPTSVCTNWLEEAQRFAPTLRPVRFGPGDRARMLDDAGPFDLIVCSYGLLQTEAERLGAVSWHTIVADEAQAIKNVQTKRSRAAMALSGNFRMITTGTPIENHLGELWNLFRFINPGLLGSLERFNQRFAVPIEVHKEHWARQRLKQLIRPFILRRLKSEVLAELPPRTEISLRVELSEAEAALYEAMRRQALERMTEPEDQPGQRRIRILAELMRLRRACCHPKLAMPDCGIPSSKLQAFTEILDELRENRHKALVFSQFVDHLTLIREHLDARGVRYQYLDGSTSPKKRKEAVDAFQAGEGELFLISLKAGGVGLNLTAADYVIHMDPWWNPAVEDQASDRAHRIGQERPVTVYRLVAGGTIEEKIVELHQHKRDLADSLLEGTNAGARLSVEDMMALIRDGSQGEGAGK